MDDQQLLEDLLELERAGWRSLCESTGDRFYGDLMTDDAVMVLANGAVMGRDAVTAALGQAPPTAGGWRCISRRPWPAERASLDGDGFGEVARLVDVVAAGPGHRSGEHL